MIEITSEIRKQLADRAWDYYSTKGKKQVRDRERVVCFLCRRPSAYFSMLDNVFVRVTSTFVVAQYGRKKICKCHPNCKSKVVKRWKVSL